MIDVFVLAEARSDQEMACGLADRVGLENPPDWWDTDAGLSSESLAAARRWTGLEPNSSFTAWAKIKQLAAAAQKEGRMSRFLGHGEGGAPGFDYASGRKALLLCALLHPTEVVRHVLIVRDMDSQPERRVGLEKLREEFASRGFILTLALPCPNREAWLIAGFAPLTIQEDENHALIKTELGFDPCQHAHRLSADTVGAPKSAKRVFHQLIEQDAPKHAREKECWAGPPLQRLDELGQRIGLREFLKDVGQTLAPTIRAEA